MEGLSSNAINILHLSDIHFGRDCRYEEDNFSKYPQGERISPGEAIKKILSPSIKLDCIVISGDLTEEGKKKEFTVFKEFLNEKLCNPLDVPLKNILLVPGNHDLQWKDKTTADDEHLKNFLLDINKEKQKIEYSSGDICYLNLEKISAGGKNLKVGIFGVNSCRIDSPKQPGIGYVGLDQLEALDHQKDSDFDVKIAVLHHHLVPVEECEPIIEKGTYSLTIDAEQILCELIKQGFSVILHGHKHRYFLAIEERPKLGQSLCGEPRILIIGGATFSKLYRTSENPASKQPPFMFNLLQVDDTFIKILTYQGIENSFRFSPTPYARYSYAHNRCNSVRRRIAESIAKYLENPDKLHDYYTLSDFDSAIIQLLEVLGAIKRKNNKLLLNNPPTPEFAAEHKELASNFLRSLIHYLNIPGLTIFDGWYDNPSQDINRPRNIRSIIQSMESKRENYYEKSEIAPLIEKESKNWIIILSAKKGENLACLLRWHKYWLTYLFPAYDKDRITLEIALDHFSSELKIENQISKFECNQPLSKTMISPTTGLLTKYTFYPVGIFFTASDSLNLGDQYRWFTKSECENFADDNEFRSNRMMRLNGTIVNGVFDLIDKGSLQAKPICKIND